MTEGQACMARDILQAACEFAEAASEWRPRIPLDGYTLIRDTTIFMHRDLSYDEIAERSEWALDLHHLYCCRYAAEHGESPAELIASLRGTVSKWREILEYRRQIDAEYQARKLAGDEW